MAQKGARSHGMRSREEFQTGVRWSGVFAFTHFLTSYGYFLERASGGPHVPNSISVVFESTCACISICACLYLTLGALAVRLQFFRLRKGGGSANYDWLDYFVKAYFLNLFMYYILTFSFCVFLYLLNSRFALQLFFIFRYVLKHR